MKYLLPALLPMLFFNAQINAQRLPSPEYTARKMRSLAEPSVFQKEIDGEVPERIAESGYRLAFNTNEDAGQSAFHLYLHILGGARTGAMVDQSWRSVRRRLADSTHTTAFEKRILGTWTTQNSTENITMKWEPDLQNKFLLQTYRKDTRISAKETEVYENKTFFKATAEPGHFTASQMDSNGDLRQMDAEYDGQVFTANWTSPDNLRGKTVYQFVDDQTIEISEFRKDEKGVWQVSNVSMLKKT